MLTEQQKLEIAKLNKQIEAECAAEAMHTCNGGDGPKWGRLDAKCPRCKALMAGHKVRTHIRVRR